MKFQASWSQFFNYKTYGILLETVVYASVYIYKQLRYNLKLKYQYQPKKFSIC